MVEIDGIKFPSKREADRYQELRLLQAGGKIEGLQCQVVYVLAPAYIRGSRKIPALRYIADFVYSQRHCDECKLWARVVEDVKGYATAAYRIKRHLMATVHGVEVLET
jgi:hypothetical protein